MGIKKMFLTLLVVLFGSCVALAQVEAVETAPIGLDARISVATENNFYGYDLFDDGGTWGVGMRYAIPELPYVGKGLYVDAEFVSPIGSGFEEQTRIDWTAGYTISFLEKSRFRIDTDVSYSYLDFIKANEKSDIHRIALKARLPNAAELFGNALVPSVEVVNLWNVSGHELMDADGVIGTIALDYYVPILEQEIDFSAGVTFNDGVFGSDSGLSHFTLGAATTVELKENVNLVPYVKYQISQEDTVAEDTLYGGVCVTINF